MCARARLDDYEMTAGRVIRTEFLRPEISHYVFCFVVARAERDATTVLLFSYVALGGHGRGAALNAAEEEPRVRTIAAAQRIAA